MEGIRRFVADLLAASNLDYTGRVAENPALVMATVEAFVAGEYMPAAREVKTRKRPWQRASDGQNDG